MLLPPNATKQEKALVDAVDYKVDPGCIRGFKFSPGEKVLPWIIEEYGLEEILRWAKDKRKAVAILGENEPHTKNCNGIYERSHQWNSLKTLYPLPQSLLPAIKFAKAQIVLSDSWNLGEVNACFPVSSIEERGKRFLLGSDKLSEQLWNLKYQPILERFSVTHHYKVEDFTNQKVIRFDIAEHNVHFESDLNSEQKDSIQELENYILVFYPGVLTWHEHRHLNRSGEEKQVICLMS